MSNSPQTFILDVFAELDSGKVIQHQETLLHDWLNEHVFSHDVANQPNSTRTQGNRLSLIAVGKAALTMTCGVLELLDKPSNELHNTSKSNGKNLDINGLDINGLVIYKNSNECSPSALQSSRHQLTIVSSSHPLLSEASLHAGFQLLDFAANQSANTPLLILISGGASALVEVLQPTWSLDAVRQLNQWLLNAELAIDDINQYRFRYSKIKNGGLAKILRNRPCLCLYASDVPNNDVSVIGSGLMKSTPMKPLVSFTELKNKHPYLAHLLTTNTPNSKIPVNDGKHDQHIVADNPWAKQQVKQLLSKRTQCPIKVHPSLYHMTLQQVVDQWVQWIVQKPNDIHICGGEFKLALPEKTGLGGRTSHLSLAIIVELTNRNHAITGTFISIASDGDDSIANQSVAWVNSTTLDQLNALNFSPQTCLDHANSGQALQRISQTLPRQPCVNNVNDIWIYVPDGLNIF